MRRLLLGLCGFLMAAHLSPVRAQVEQTSCVKRSSPQVSEPNVELILEGPQWNGWNDFCGKLTDYLQLGAGPFDDATVDQLRAQLVNTGFFELAVCEVESDGHRLSCSLLPRAIVHTIGVRGNIPFAILKRSIRRRVFLRPGQVLGYDPELLERQQERVEEFLELEGFFLSSVDVELKPDPGGWPNRGVEVGIVVDAGTPARLRGVSVNPESPLKVGTIDDIVRHYTPLWLWELRFRPRRFNEDLEKIEAKLRKEGWPAARVRGSYQLLEKETAANATVIVRSGPRLELDIEGNESIRTRRLERLAAFREAQSVDALALADTTAAMRKEYQRRGFYDVRITPTLETSRTTARVLIDVKEGPRARIRAVRLEGNDALSSEQVREGAGLATRKAGLLGGGRWVQEFVDRDQRAIAAYYRRQGFENVAVKAARQVDEDGITVTFDISEGTRRMVHEVSVLGIPATIDADELLDKMQTRADRPLVTEWLLNDEQRILAALLQDGYVQGNVHRDVSVSEAGSATVTFRVDSGRQFFLGGVLVRGNFRTRTSFVEQTLSVDAGEPLDLVALGRAKRRLRALGVFGSVDLSPLTPNDETQDIWVLAALEERNRLTLDAIFAYETDVRGTIGASFSDHNLFGRAIRLDVTGRVGNAFKYIHPRLKGGLNSVEARLRAPQPFGIPFDIEGRAAYRLEESQNFYQEETLIASRASRKLLTPLDCKQCPLIIGSWRYDLSAQSFRQTDTEANLNVGKIGAGVSVDRRDSPVDPRKGYYGSVRAFIAHPALSPGRSASLWKATFQLSGAWPLVKTRDDNPIGPLIVAATGQYGMAKPYGETNVLPEPEAFAYGGDYSLRGATKRASALAFPASNYLFLGSAELRWYFLRDAGPGDLQLAAFMDVGSVAYNFDNLFEITTVSVGPALRYVTLVGPISLEYGRTVVRPQSIVGASEEDDLLPRRGRIHVTFGYSF